MKARILTLVPCVFFALWGGATGATWYVDDSVSSSGDGTSWQTAFQTMQQGINSASNSDTVLVAQGTYVENIKFNGKNIILTSTDPLDPSVVANTIIDGGGNRSVVTFDGTEDETCALSGFTIRNGFGNGGDWGSHGGGISGGGWGHRTHATIRNNVVTRNAVVDSGGGLAYCDGLIRSNVVSENHAYNGGGLSTCGGVIEYNTIVFNEAEYGGGLCGWDGNLAGQELYGATIRNNIIAGNRAEGWDARIGGGLSHYDGVIENNLVCNNTSGYGGGLAYCGPVLQNNTIVGNFASTGGGLYFCGSIIRNSIIWGNKAGGTGNQLDKCTMPSYCCIEGWTGGGPENISGNPLFMDPDGGDDQDWTYEDNDYRLRPESPCINAGANYYWFCWPQRGLDGNCRLALGTVDIGCYEFGSDPDTDGDLLSDSDEVKYKTYPFNEDSDGDGLRDGLEVLRGTDPLIPTCPGILRVPSDISSPQMALCLAVPGDEIVVSPGNYAGNFHFVGMDVVLRSLNPDDPDIVRSTVLNGVGSGPAVTFTGKEGSACALAGFTITGGSATNGGGVLSAAHRGRRTEATVEKNLITANFAECGGGLAYCNGGIVQNTIKSNYAGVWGGGLYLCGGTIRGNVISSNTSAHWGGGLFRCSGVVCDNTITGNAAQDGSAFDQCTALIEGNIISGNSAETGGAVRSSMGPIRNNTICGNIGGGLRYCDGVIQNCIIWANVPDQIFQSASPAYSCIQGWTGEGEGNIAADPRFVDAENGNFRLRADSPCIDAGLNSPELPETDIGGMHRIMYGGKSLTVDMGADEFYINKLEPVPGTNEAIFTWSSLEGKTYTIFYTDHLFTWHLAVAAFPSSGNQTTFWTDDGSLTSVPPFLAPKRFYRVLENP